jgi:hypothetical protein
MELSTRSHPTRAVMATATAENRQKFIDPTFRSQINHDFVIVPFPQPMSSAHRRERDTRRQKPADKPRQFAIM